MNEFAATAEYPGTNPGIQGCANLNQHMIRIEFKQEFSYEIPIENE